MMAARCLVLLAALVLAAQTAWARDVYLNGVRLEPNVVLTNRSFAGCDVKFDEHGDVWITARGILVALSPAPPAPAGQGEGKANAATESGRPQGAGKVPVPAAAGMAQGDPAQEPAPASRPARRYWLVSRQPGPGGAQQLVDVYMNDVLVKTVRSTGGPTVVDITRHVKAGTNRVRLVARATGEPMPGRPGVLEIVLGEGVAAEGTVKIEAPLVIFQRNTAETGDLSEERTFSGR